jgi:hypothetical protein
MSRILDYLYHCTTYNCIFTCDIIKYLSKLSFVLQLTSLIAIPGPRRAPLSAEKKADILTGMFRSLFGISNHLTYMRLKAFGLSWAQ